MVITAFDQAAYLTETVRSALEQRGTSVEVVVVDDGSTDGSAAVAEAAGAHRVLRQRNAGAAAARNAGLRAATTSSVVFLDGDDRLHPHAVRTQLDVLAAHPDAEYVVARARLIDRQGRPLPSRVEPVHEGPLYPQLLRCSWICPPSALLVRRDAAERVGGWDEVTPFAEDLDFYLRLAMAARGIDHRAVLTDYRLHQGMSSRSYSAGLEANLAVLRRHAPDDGDPRLAAARRAGERHYLRTYGYKAVLSEARADVRAGRGTTRAVRRVARLVAADPAGVSRLLLAAARRRRR